MANIEMNRIEELVNAQGKAFIPSHYQLKVIKVSEPEQYSNEYGEGNYNLNAGDAKLEGTRGEHWSPVWKKIVSKYQTLDGNTIVPDELPSGQYVDIMTPVERSVREKSVIWAIDAALVADDSFAVGDLTIDPAVDMLCCSDNNGAPDFTWGCWPVKKEIFEDTYEEK